MKTQCISSRPGSLLNNYVDSRKKYPLLQKYNSWSTLFLSKKFAVKIRTLFQRLTLVQSLSLQSIHMCVIFDRTQNTIWHTLFQVQGFPQLRIVPRQKQTPNFLTLTLLRPQTTPTTPYTPSPPPSPQHTHIYMSNTVSLEAQCWNQLVPYKILYHELLQSTPNSFLKDGFYSIK